MLISHPFFYVKRIGIVSLFILIHGNTFAMEPCQKKALFAQSELHLERLKALKDNIDTWTKNVHSLYPKIRAWRQSNDYHSDMSGYSTDNAHFNAENFYLNWAFDTSKNEVAYIANNYTQMLPPLILDLTSPKDTELNYRLNLFIKEFLYEALPYYRTNNDNLIDLFYKAVTEPSQTPTPWNPAPTKYPRPELPATPFFAVPKNLDEAKNQIMEILTKLIQLQNNQLQKESLAQQATRTLCKRFTDALAYQIEQEELNDQIIEQIIIDIPQQTFEHYCDSFFALFKIAKNTTLKSLIKKRSVLPSCVNGTVISKFLTLLPLDERVEAILALNSNYKDFNTLACSEKLDELHAIMAHTATACNNPEQRLKIFNLVFQMNNWSGHPWDKTLQLTNATACYMIANLPFKHLEECADLFVTFVNQLQKFEKGTDHTTIKLLIKQLSTISSTANVCCNLVDVFFLPLVLKTNTGPRYVYNDNTPNFFGSQKVDYYLSTAEMATAYAKKENSNEFREVLKKIAQSRDSLPHRQRVQALRDELEK